MWTALSSYTLSLQWAPLCGFTYITSASVATLVRHFSKQLSLRSRKPFQSGLLFKIKLSFFLCADFTTRWIIWWVGFALRTSSLSQFSSGLLWVVMIFSTITLSLSALGWMTICLEILSVKQISPLCFNKFSFTQILITLTEWGQILSSNISWMATTPVPDRISFPLRNLIIHGPTVHMSPSIPLYSYH